MSGYFKNIKEAVSTMTSGLKLTLKYFVEARYSHKPVGVEDPSYFEQDRGIVTLQYPKESIPVPDNGRYKLHNEIDDCIVCDKCAKVCPVDCIEIDPIRAVETYGYTSDGTPKKIHAAKFDIDMSKCCYCGLCTVVCPTECLTMTKEYDYSEFDVEDHVFSFGNMPLVEIAEKRKELAEMEAIKEAEKAQKANEAGKPATKPKPLVAKPKSAIRPKPIDKKEPEGDSDKPKKMKPVMKAKPVMKPRLTNEKSDDQPKTTAKSKPVVKPRPVIKKIENKDSEGEKPKVIKPKMKPVIKPKTQAKPQEDNPKSEKPKYRPRPVIPKKKKNDGDE